MMASVRIRIGSSAVGDVAGLSAMTVAAPAARSPAAAEAAAVAALSLGPGKGDGGGGARVEVDAVSYLQPRTSTITI